MKKKRKKKKVEFKLLRSFVNQHTSLCKWIVLINQKYYITIYDVQWYAIEECKFLAFFNLIREFARESNLTVNIGLMHVIYLSIVSLVVSSILKQGSGLIVAQVWGPRWERMAASRPPVRGSLFQVGIRRH